MHRNSFSITRWITVFAVQLLCALNSIAQAPARDGFGLLPWSEQIAVREQWLERHHRLILPMMREHGIDMWIIVNEEFHNDPLTNSSRLLVLTLEIAISSSLSIADRMAYARLQSQAMRKTI
jgi:hypothetical protein